MSTKKPGYFAQLYSLIFRSYRTSYGLIEDKPIEVNHGSSWEKPSGVRPFYDPMNSLSAFAVHAYTHAAASRAAQDLAALPLRIIEGRGKDSKIIESGDIVELFEYPSTDTNSFDFREQLEIDLMLSGNCYILLLGATDKPVSMVRLHPAEVRIITSSKEGELYYEHNSDGNISIYAKDRVLHGKTASWRKGSGQIYGCGGIEPLAKEITADLNAMKLASEASAKGRPDILLYPKDEADIWGKERRREILSQYRGLASEGGALCLSGAVEMRELKVSPREMEFQASRKFAREGISAVLGVPFSIMGGDSSNYATARSQAIGYWTNQVKRAKRMSGLFTKIARRFNPDYRVEYDFSGVEALQSVRTEKLKRIEKHIKIGNMTIEDAYRYEGLEDAPLGPSAAEKPSPDSIGEEEEENVRMLVRYLSKFTDFPLKGEDEELSFGNSKYKQFDVQYALELKYKYPSIWRSGSSIAGTNIFPKLYPIARRKSRLAITKPEEAALRKREEWSKMHFEEGSDFEDPALVPTLKNVDGIVAQIRMLSVGAMGERNMKIIIDQMKTNLYEKSMPPAFTSMPTAITKSGIWKGWIDKKHAPQEQRMFRSVKGYLKQAQKRYIRRLKAQLRSKKAMSGSVLRSVSDWTTLLDRAGEQRYILLETGRTWLEGWTSAGITILEEVYRKAGIENVQAQLQFGAKKEAQKKMNTYAREVAHTTADTIESIISNGLAEGISIAEMSKSIQAATAFDPARARLIARTETTRSVNHATSEAYKEAATQGVRMKKEWLSSRDPNVRESHAELDGQRVGVNDLFTIDGQNSDSPGNFGIAGEDINCRCTIIAAFED